MNSKTSLASRRPSGTAEFVNILLGVWVAVSPFVLGLSRSAAIWNNVAVGVALVVVAVVGIWADEAFQGLGVLLGAWLFESPFILGFSTAAFLANNTILAFVVIAAAASSDGLRLTGTAENSPAPPIRLG